MIIACDNARKGVCKDRPQNCRSAACSNAEINNDGRDEDPEGAAVTFGFPAGFVYIESLLLGKSLSDFLGNRLRRYADPLKDIAGSPKADVNSE